MSCLFGVVIQLHTVLINNHEPPSKARRLINRPGFFVRASTASAPPGRKTESTADWGEAVSSYVGHEFTCCDCHVCHHICWEMLRPPCQKARKLKSGISAQKVHGASKLLAAALGLHDAGDASGSCAVAACKKQATDSARVGVSISKSLAGSSCSEPASP